MSRPTARRCAAPGIRVPAGEVLVATEIGDPVRGPLSCPAAVLVGGALKRRGMRVRYGAVPHCDQSSRPGEGAALFLTTADRHGGATTGIGAAADPADGVALAAARSAVEEWSAVVGPRRLLRAASPWCHGAIRALERARQVVARGPGPVYVYEWLAGGDQDRADLEAAGAVFVTSTADVPTGATVVFPAHGVPPAVRAEADERGLAVIDATCPLVAAVHEQIRGFAARGDQVVVVGPAGHAVSTPIASQAPDRIIRVESPAGVGGVHAADPRRMSYVLQPGIPVEDTTGVSTALGSRFPALRRPDPDTFCYAATDRAQTIRAIASGADLVLVLGADEHPDSKMVAALVRASGAKAQVVCAPDRITASWLAGTTAIGLVEAVTCTPGLAAEVARVLSGLGPLSVTSRRVTTQVDRPPRVAGGAGGLTRRPPGLPGRRRGGRERFPSGGPSGDTGRAARSRPVSNRAGGRHALPHLARGQLSAARLAH